MGSTQLEASIPYRHGCRVCLLCILPIGFTLLSRDSSQPLTYSTAKGENRTVLLDDGSVVYLNTRTTLSWQFDEDIRRVDLVEGEALFDVTPEVYRPFVVHAGAGVVRVLGTRFNVHRKNGSDVVVTVLEGRVRSRRHGRAFERTQLAKKPDCKSESPVSRCGSGLRGDRDGGGRIGKLARWRNCYRRSDPGRNRRGTESLFRATDRDPGSVAKRNTCGRRSQDPGISARLSSSLRTVVYSG